MERLINGYDFKNIQDIRQAFLCQSGSYAEPTHSLLNRIYNWANAQGYGEELLVEELKEEGLQVLGDLDDHNNTLLVEVSGELYIVADDWAIHLNDDLLSDYLGREV